MLLATPWVSRARYDSGLMEGDGEVTARFKSSVAFDGLMLYLANPTDGEPVTYSGSKYGLYVDSGNLYALANGGVNFIAATSTGLSYRLKRVGGAVSIATAEPGSEAWTTKYVFTDQLTTPLQLTARRAPEDAAGRARVRPRAQDAFGPCGLRGIRRGTVAGGAGGQENQVSGRRGLAQTVADWVIPMTAAAAAAVLKLRLERP